ncbi:hypothetical protein A3J44_04160 [candidate division WOR-1 bacterium RIFCSPHIGHO2_02_FULL_45_12]|nr:MAG: hypothetical protein A3J44_04160 [candidate division WOR-1 bacterium RIFCSPHIGHO2_02_FULL_45_12]
MIMTIITAKVRDRLCLRRIGEDEKHILIGFVNYCFIGGFGLTEASDDVSIKIIIEREFV